MTERALAGRRLSTEVRERPQQTVSLRLIWTLAMREMQDSRRDWRIVVPVALLTLVFPYIMKVGAAIVFDFLEGYDAVVIGERFIPFGLLAVGFFPMSFSLVIALESFVGERERNSLEALLATPASDVELYVGKLIASLLPPLLASYVGIAIYAGILVANEQWALPGTILLQILALTTAEGLVMVTAAVIVSSHTTTVRAANLLASFIIVPMALLLQIESLIIFWGRTASLWWIVVGLIVLDITLLRAGINTFNRETILAREIDHLDVGRAVRLLWAFLRASPADVRRVKQAPDDMPAFSLRRFYGRDLPLLLQRERLALLTCVVVMGAAVLAGWALADVWRLPASLFDFEVFDPEMLRRGAATETGVSILPQFSAGAIFWHNLRTLLIAALLSLLSLGVSALAVLALPVALVGYLTANVMAAGQNSLQFLMAFILPHGVVELLAVVLASAFAVRIGAALLGPSHGMTASEGVLLALADFVRVFLLVVLPLLALAAVLEVYLTPHVIVWLYG